MGLAVACTPFAAVIDMRTVTLPLPMFGFVISTRAALAAGIGLLLADRMSTPRRRAVGAALVAVGAVTTVPLAWFFSRALRRSRMPAAVDSDARLVGVTRFARKGDDIP